MKIVHLLLTPRFAGSERYAVELANAQAAAGHEVVMVLHRRGAEQRPDAIAHRLDARVRRVLVGGWRPLAIWAARRVVDAEAPDVAHAHLSLGCRALHGRRKAGLRVATLHIRYKPSQHDDLDALIAIAPWQLAGMPEARLKHTRQIDNWTAAGPFDPAARARVRAEAGIAESDFVIGALGRCDASKGLDALIDAYEAARPAGTRLVIAGGGAEWARLRRKAAADIVMPGFVARPQDWFSAMDAFVSAATSEPFGLVFLEAMAAGLPLVATASEGGQFFAGSLCHPLVPVDDRHALQQALSFLGATRPGRCSHDLTAYAIETAVARIEAFYLSELQASA